MQEWEQSSCLKFVRRTTEKNYIAFFKGSGWHAMGFWHEQSRPDRDSHVEIIWKNIPEGRDYLSCQRLLKRAMSSSKGNHMIISSAMFLSYSDKKHNFRKYNRTQVDSLGVPYDYLSVMHYSSTAFGNGRTTIIAKEPSVVQLGQRIGLSPMDIKQADLLYECHGTTTRPQVIPSPQPPPNGPDDCTFENGLCGWTNVDGDYFDWTIRMGKTPSGNTGPATDHTTLRFGEFNNTLK
ncbi:meprin A subunit beta-like [Orbicella faveolata]|uniref:meprin A subunit beta-like n=1 Tax=Orbicella faveolata TaxID=48498 RepID=UPI0009E20B7C|nr:meprin A subunit beta-like [Orbicella faveolata]